MPGLVIFSGHIGHVLSLLAVLFRQPVSMFQPMRAGAILGQYTPLVPVLDGLDVRFTAISFPDASVSYRPSSIGIKLSFMGQLAHV